MKDLLEDEPKMVEHANTYEKRINGAEQVTLLLQQNGASYNSEHSERREHSVDENKPEMAKKEKTYTFKARTLHIFLAVPVSLFITVIGLAVWLGILLTRSSTDHNPCPQGWVLPKPTPSHPYPSCVPACPQGWVVHEAWCYYFSTVEANWNSSQSNCSSYGGSLTAIDTPSEMKFLLNEKEATDYWIGLRRKEGQPWKWTNGSDFNSWFKIGADGLCAYLNDRNASSTWCTSEREWICRTPHLPA